MPISREQTHLNECIEHHKNTSLYLDTYRQNINVVVIILIWITHKVCQLLYNSSIHLYFLSQYRNIDNYVGVGLCPKKGKDLGYRCDGEQLRGLVVFGERSVRGDLTAPDNYRKGRL